MMCFHKWEEKERIQTRRMDKFRGEGSMSEYLAERLLLGVTTIVLKCSKCGDVKSKEFLGV